MRADAGVFSPPLEGLSRRLPWDNPWNNAGRKWLLGNGKRADARVRNGRVMEGPGPARNIRKARVGGSNPFVGSHPRQRTWQTRQRWTVVANGCHVGRSPTGRGLNVAAKFAHWNWHPADLAYRPAVDSESFMAVRHVANSNGHGRNAANPSLPAWRVKRYSSVSMVPLVAACARFPASLPGTRTSTPPSTRR